MHTNPIAPTLASLVPGPPVSFENLTMIPLARTPALSEAQAKPRRVEGPRYSTLDAALMARTCEITEVSDHGSVPELRVVNRGLDPVLIVDGEELVGAKQNRVVNLTILVAAQSELTIPVSCVEAGRWRARSRTFASAPRAQYAAGRAKRMSQVSACMRDLGGHHADQADVWQGIAEKSARLGASSPTSAMEAMYVDHGARLDQFVRATGPVDGQVGALFAVNGEIVGLDLFDSPETLRALLPKLVRSVALDAIDVAVVSEPEERVLSADSPTWCSGPKAHATGEGPVRHAGRPPPSRKRFGGQAVRGHPREVLKPEPAVLVSAAVPYFIAALSSAPAHVAPAVGRGEDIRLSAAGLTGAALIVDGVVIHASGFVM